MKKIRQKFNRYCVMNRNKGIPNLMLYIVVGSAIVYLLSMTNGGVALYDYLRFDKALILKGQIWRLFTYVFTYTPGNAFMVLIFLYFFYNLSRTIEQVMGTFRFNLFYFSGVLIMDIVAMLLCPTKPLLVDGYLYSAELISSAIYGNMAYYMHLSLILMFSTMSPDSQFLVFFIIPVKAWFLALLDLVLIGIEVYNLAPFFPHNLFPLAGLANYLLFAGKDVFNLIPFSFRLKTQRLFRKKPKRKADGPRVIPFPDGNVKKATPHQPKAAYNHKCTVCGRTDVSNPELEFRYCSRCSGYKCYCEDHINNHNHE